MKTKIVLFVFMMSAQLLYSQVRDNIVGPLNIYERSKDFSELGVGINVKIIPEHPDDNDEFEIQISINIPECDSMIFRLVCPSGYINFINEKNSRIIEEHIYPSERKCFKRTIKAKFVKFFNESDIYNWNVEDMDMINLNLFTDVCKVRYLDGRRITIFRKKISVLDRKKYGIEYLKRVDERNKQNNDVQLTRDTVVVVDSTDFINENTKTKKSSEKTMNHITGYVKIFDLDDDNTLIPFKNGVVALYSYPADVLIRSVFTDDYGNYSIETSENNNDKFTLTVIPYSNFVAIYTNSGYTLLCCMNIFDIYGYGTQNLEMNTSMQVSTQGTFHIYSVIRDGYLKLTTDLHETVVSSKKLIILFMDNQSNIANSAYYG